MSTEIEFYVDEGTYTAIMLGRPSKYYPETLETPAEYPECDFIVEDEHGCEIVDLCGFEEETLAEVESLLIQAYYDDIADRRGEEKLNRMLGK